MSRLSSVLRSSDDGHGGQRLTFLCPGCDDYHSIAIGSGPGPRWDYNGNPEKPTFTPSVKVTYPANPDADDDFKEWRTERVCHSFVRDGRIQFLGDCTHALAGQTVDLPEWGAE
ncbi:MAG: DUF6527 family protein [Burkholderiaceae bacterium]